MKNCEWCENLFEAAVPYQIYCSSECRELATKEKVAQKYAERRRKRMKAQNRLCKSCGHSLSVYNDEQICQTCIVNPVEVSKALREIKGIVSGKTNLTDE